MKASVYNWLLRNRPFLVFGPLILAYVVRLYLLRAIDLCSAAGLWLAGLAAWTFLEWTAHRAMHAQTRFAWISRLQDTAHLRHHREPDDLEHSVIRLSASLPLAGFFGLIARLILGDWHLAAAFHGGLLIGYLFYEFVHLTAHEPRRIPGMHRLHRHHTLHHFADSHRAFGVTSSLWDWVFGTRPTTLKNRSEVPHARIQSST